MSTDNFASVQSRTHSSRLPKITELYSDKFKLFKLDTNQNDACKERVTQSITSWNKKKISGSQPFIQCTLNDDACCFFPRGIWWADADSNHDQRTENRRFLISVHYRQIGRRHNVSFGRISANNRIIINVNL